MKTFTSSHENYYPLVFLFAGIKFLLHLGVNAFGGYGIFRDELYYYACMLRPDMGYVDQPPLSVWILGIVTFLFGKSIFAMRLAPAIFGALALLPITGSVRLLGGSKKAIIVASIAFILSPICLAYCTYYSMNSIDILLWSTAIYLVIKLFATEKSTLWLWLGFVMGLALLNKIGMLWFGFGLFIALLVTRQRHWLATRWPYLCAFIAGTLFLPYIVWNAMHGWPTLEFMAGAAQKYSSQSRLGFLAGQLIINNPFNIPVWLAGIVFLVKNRDKAPVSVLMTIFVTVLGILLASGNVKPEYLSQIFVVLFISGAVMIEKWTAHRKWIANTVIAVQCMGAIVVPMALPVFPVEKFISYSQTLGMAPTTAENHKLEELPQFFADMFGWENQARAVAEVYHKLSAEDKAICGIFGDNYGRCGAIDYYRDKYDLPLSIGNHNSYWIWGPSVYDGRLLIILSREVGDKIELFEDVQDMGIVHSPYAMPYENNLRIYLCRNLKMPLKDAWQQIRHYD